MTKEKWLDLKDRIEENFEVEKFFKSDLENVPNSVVETIIFVSPIGKIKLEWISKPKTLGEKTQYSNRVGSYVQVDKIYSETERSEFLKAYKYENDDWQEISTHDFTF